MADRYDDRYRDDRGFAERAGDEVRSWFGDEEAARRRRIDEERYGREHDWPRGRDWGHRMGLDYERRPGRDWSDRTYGYGGYGSSERGVSGERWGGEREWRDWETPSHVQRFHNEGRTGYYETRTPYSGVPSQSFGYSTPSAGFGPGPGGYGTASPAPRETGHTGRGPRGYQRSDERIREDVCDRLTDDPWVDASEVEVQVRNGEVTLGGTVRDRNEKRRTEDIIESVSGVRNVHNNLRVGTGVPATPNATQTR